MEKENYDDIIKFPHHISRVHPQMSMYARAAQFAPFAALTGHDAAIQETARLTDASLELSEQEQADLDNILAQLLASLHDKPMVSITHFIPDERKEGGRYVCSQGRLTKWDEIQMMLTLEDGTTIAIRDIIDITYTQD